MISRTANENWPQSVEYGLCHSPTPSNRATRLRVCCPPRDDIPAVLLNGGGLDRSLASESEFTAYLFRRRRRWASDAVRYANRSIAMNRCGLAGVTTAEMPTASWQPPGRPELARSASFSSLIFTVITWAALRSLRGEFLLVRSLITARIGRATMRLQSRCGRATAGDTKVQADHRQAWRYVTDSGHGSHSDKF